MFYVSDLVALRDMPLDTIGVRAIREAENLVDKGCALSHILDRGSLSSTKDYWQFDPSSNNPLSRGKASSVTCDFRGVEFI